MWRMTTTVVALQSVKPPQDKASRAARRSIDKDTTRYPDWEPVSRSPCENEICLDLQPMMRRHQAARQTVCHVGSDAFIYWTRGNNENCVSPDVYILPGIPQTAMPTDYVGANDERCWKTWIHASVPNFALEVKAWRNPRKDELQSPERHNALGTNELIVFDPFWQRRRGERRRFAVHRRDATGKLVVVLATNDDRVFSEELQAFVVAEGNDDKSRLRLALGPNGETLLPLDSERADMEARRADEATRLQQEEARRADEATRLQQEEARRADEATRLRQEEARRADEATRLRQEEARRADEATRLQQEEARRADEATRLRQEEARRADEATRLRQEEARRADEATRLQQEEARRADDEARRADDEARRADDEARQCQEQSRRADEATRMAQDAARRMAELEAELEQLRASTGKRRKR